MIYYQIKMQLTKQYLWCDFFCQKMKRRKKRHPKNLPKIHSKVICLLKSSLVTTSELWDN